MSLYKDDTDFRVYIFISDYRRSERKLYKLMRESTRIYVSGICEINHTFSLAWVQTFQPIFYRRIMYVRRLSEPGGSFTVLGSISGLNPVENSYFCPRSLNFFVKKGFSPFVYKKKLNLQIEGARRIGQHIRFSLQLKPEIKLVFLRKAVWFLGKILDIR